MRCLTLANELAARGAECIFLVGDRTLETVPALGGSGFAARDVKAGAEDLRQALDLLPERADLMIFDSYAIGREYELEVSDRSSHVLVIDDLANRPHHCDMLLDQTPGRLASAYEGLVPEVCQVLAGAEFALLRPQFLRDAAASRARRTASGAAHRLLLSMGLTDVGGVTETILHVIRKMPFGQIDVVTPRSAPSRHYAERSAIEDPRITVHAEDKDMADLMLHADIAIGAAGITALERCCLGLPTVMLQLADNQAGIVAELTTRGAALIARDGESAARLALDLAHDVPRLRAVSAAAARLVDGHGARRLGDALRELCGGFDGAGISLRPARLDDARLLFEWRNDAETRRQSRDSAELSWADHLRWLETKLADPRCRLLIAEAGRQVGTVRIDRVDEGDTSIFVLSWTVAPEARGKGYGKLIVRAARPEGRVRAYVKRDNPASQAIAAAAGLRLVEDSALQVWEGDATD